MSVGEMAGTGIESALELPVELAVRLECLRVAHHFDAAPNEVVERAQAYAEFVLGKGSAAEVRATSGDKIVKDSEISDAL